MTSITERPTAMLHPVRLRLAAAALASALAFPAAAQLGLDLTEPKPPAAKPKPPAPAPKQAAPVTMQGLDLNAAPKGDAGKRIAEANAVFGRGDYEMAVLAYDAILRDPGLAEAHDQARYQLSKSLVKLGLDHAALARLDEILAKGPQGTKYYYDAFEWLFQLGQRVDESVIVAEVARRASGTFPPDAQDRFSYLLARYQYERGQALDELGRAAEAKRSYDEARRLISQVRPEAGASAQAKEGAADAGDVYARARFIEGLVQYAQGTQQAAVDSFKEVVRLTNPRRARAPDLRTRELAFLQLARIHYEHKQNRYAIFYYDKMPWGGQSWLEGLWEASYAHYRIGNYEKALGNLLTLQSPYFRDEWFPESWILKAIIYYENCRYPEARAILDDFRTQFEGVQGELDRITAQAGTPGAFYELLEDAQRGRGAAAQGQATTKRVVKVALTDPAVRRLNGSILAVEREMDQGLAGRGEAFRSSALARDLKDQLTGERKRLLEEAGARARAKLEYERDGLRDLLQQALRIKIEVARREREGLESTLSGGAGADVIRDYRYSVAVSDEHLYWPYDGEFWRDELGTYTYTLTKGCRDTGARGEK